MCCRMDRSVCQQFPLNEDFSELSLVILHGAFGAMKKLSVPGKNKMCRLVACGASGAIISLRST